MQLENPWVQSACADNQVAPNSLPTHLQEQYGQLGEDLILEGVLRSHFAAAGLPPQAIRYMEIGANHPIQTSNTYLFHRKWGGRGVLVEANPALVDALTKVRPHDRVLHCAVVPPGYPAKVTISVAENAELSSIDANHVASFGSIGLVESQIEVASITLDELLAACGDELHLLSLDIEGLDYEVLARSTLPRRPLFVVTEPSRHYHAGAEDAFARTMTGHDYIEIARTEYNLIYRDRRSLAQVAAAPAPTQVSPREVIRTFDIFDTLISRRCIHPQQVFVEMEKRSGITGLARQRVAAERRVQQGPQAQKHVLGDIYRELAQALDLDTTQAETLAKLEVDIELEQIVPIADNLARVDAQSVLISDMYLPESIIRAMLRKAGLGLDLPLLRSNDGKASGRIWREISAQGMQCHHLGDNAQSDVALARAAGMRAELSTQHATSNFEQELFLAGLTETAMSLRAARLATSAANLPQALRTLQLDLNLPTLLVASIVALTHAQAAGIGQIGFASRDGRALQAIADMLIASGRFGALRTRYWYTSRLARSSGAPDYLDYCREFFDQTGLLVDLCGTGTSVTRLTKSLGLAKVPRLFVAEHVHAPAHVREMSALYRLAEAPQLPLHVFDTRNYICNVTLEMLNYAPEGMVRSVRRLGADFLPQRDPIDLDGEALDLARRQHAYLLGLIAALGREVAANPALVQEWLQALPRFAKVLHERVNRYEAEQAQLKDWFRAAHDANEVALKAELARRR